MDNYRAENEARLLSEFYSYLEVISANKVHVRDWSEIYYTVDDFDPLRVNHDPLDNASALDPVRTNSELLNPHSMTIEHVPLSYVYNEENRRSIEIAEEIKEEMYVSQVPYIIDELLTIEQSYINTLKRGISVYMSVFDENFENASLPLSLRGQKNHLFGNIERILDFHENVFYPSLKRFDSQDVSGICETFCRFCTENGFYSYVLYAINSKRGDRLATKNRDFFAQRQAEYQDRLGLNSFLLQPIQRLPRYQLLLGKLIGELGKRLDVDVREKIGSCCRAEKHLQRLLDQVNSSMSLHDIVENHEINVQHQGIFRFVHKFVVYECESRQRYDGKAFLFDKGILVTEMREAQTLIYRGFLTTARMGMANLSSCRFALFDVQRKATRIELETEINAADLWMRTLEDMIGTRSQVKIEQRDSGIGDDAVSMNSVLMNTIVLRNADNAQMHNTPSDTSWSSSLSIYSTTSSRDSDPLRTTWYTAPYSNAGQRRGKSLERLINCEKHFVLTMSEYHRDVVQSKLSLYFDKFKVCLQFIKDFHRNQLYPKVLQCNGDILSICKEFQLALKSKPYTNAYLTYAATFSKITGINPQYKFLPLEHLGRTFTYVDQLLSELMVAGHLTITPETKAVAVLSVEMNRLRDRVRDNQNLYLIKNDAVYSNVVWSEPCMHYGRSARLLCLEDGVVCVYSKISSKSNQEKFTSIEFAIPLVNLRLVESNRSRSRIKLCSSFTPENELKLDFTTESTKLRIQKNLTDSIKAVLK